MSEQNLLVNLSSQLADLVQQVGPSVVRVDDASRLTASGIIWSADGVIVATSHGVERDEELFVELADGTRHAATVAGRDPGTDLAAIRVQATGLPAVQRASVDDAQVGQLVLALGRPGDAGLQATIGIVGARMETESDGQIGYLLHTDAVLYPGFSGGPLVDMQGQTVGLNNLTYGRGRALAVGVPIVGQVVDALLAHGKIQHGYLGIRSQNVALPAALQSSLGLEQESGIMVVQVDAGTPAENAGLLLGDILLSIAGHPIPHVDELRSQLRNLTVGQVLTLGILRGGQRQELTATLGPQP